MKWLFVGIALVVEGCSVTPNPRSCLDGSCTDPAYPYCDVEGLIEEPQSCVAVECTAGDFKACRDDRAITCNSTGNNFDLVECPHGCDANGCITPEEIDCTTNAECANPAPICSSEMTCRGCADDGECSSLVCEETGACRVDGAIVYAAPAGVTTGSCTLAAPCSLDRAILQATSVAGKTLRMLPGNYASDLAVRGNTLLEVVATGATLAGAARLIVENGATVDVRGLSITSSDTNSVACGDQVTGAPLSRLTLRDVTGAKLNIKKCSLTMIGGTAGALSTAFADSTFDADRVHFTFQFTSILGQRIQITIKNSVLEGGLALFTSDPTGSAGSKLTVSFSTFVFSGTFVQQTCDTAGMEYARTEHFENNIFVGTNGESDVVIPRRCTFTNNIMFPQATPIANNNVVDPMLVDIDAKNYHLLQSSPAINAAVPSAGLSTDHDYERIPRPQGAAADIGAFELVP